MSPLPPGVGSFQETFCAQYGVPPDLYAATVLRLTIYPHARWLVDMTPEQFLAPDRRFVASVGRLTRWAGFDGEAREFQRLPENRRFWRRTLRLRVSVGRMRVLFSEVMGDSTSSRARGLERRDTAPNEPGSLAAD